MTATSTALAMAELAPDSPAAKAVAQRAEIFAMTQAAEDAVLRPQEPGRWPHDLRAALAARIAHLNDFPTLAARYLDAAGHYTPLAAPKADGEAEGLTPVLRFMDKVAAKTKEVEARDVADLQSAGIEDADIVRLAELNAFMAYQIRVIRGLQLISGAA